MQFAKGTSSAGPVGHQVTYTITSKIEQYTEIGFIANQPANETDYADNSQKYLFLVRPKVNPDAPWSYTTTLANPERWAWLGAGDFYAFYDVDLPPMWQRSTMGTTARSPSMAMWWHQIKAVSRWSAAPNQPIRLSLQ